MGLSVENDDSHLLGTVTVSKNRIPSFGEREGGGERRGMEEGREGEGRGGGKGGEWEGKEREGNGGEGRGDEKGKKRKEGFS